MQVNPIRFSRYTEAVVGFGGEPTLWWMKFLKKGFYHCVVAVGSGNEWILIDPLIHCNDIVFLEISDVESFLNKNGYTTIRCKIEEPKKRSLSIVPYTCVETVKRFIGVKNCKIITPFQLFNYLNEKIGKKSLTFE